MKLRNLLVVMFVVLALAQAAVADVVINEIMPNPTGTEPDGEWIELFSDTEQNLLGWTITDGEGTFTFPDVTIFAGGHYILYHTFPDGSSSVPESSLEYGTSTVGALELANGDDELTLSDDLAVEQDSVSYGEVGDDVESAPGEDETVARVHDGEDLIVISDEPTQYAANNRLPTAEDNIISTDEDTTYVFSGVEFDFDDADLDGLASLIITQLDGAGTLAIDGEEVPVFPDIEVWIDDITADMFTFVPEENAFGPSYAAFEFSVSDGIGFSVDSYTLTIDVTSVNDPPTLSIPNADVDEDAGTVSFDLLGFASDVEDEDDDLTFSIDDQSDTSAIACVLNADGFTLDCTTVADQTGSNDVTITVEDSDTGTATSDFTITVNPVNDAPVASDVIASTDEDVEVFVELTYTDVDGDEAVDAAVSAVVGGSLTTDPVCAAGVCTVGLTPDVDSTDNITTEFTVNDGTVDSNLASITVNVDAVNDAPVITSEAKTSATQGLEYTYTLTATDVDSAASLLAIDTTASEVNGESFVLIPEVSAAGLTFSFTSDFAETITVSVVVSDGTSLSDPQVFDIVIAPAIEIKEESFSVMIGDVVSTTFSTLEFNVTPGENVDVAFKFQNNLDVILGYVDITAVSDVDPDFIAYEDTVLAVLPGLFDQSHAFSFTVPEDIAEDTFEVEIEVADETVDGSTYDASIVLTFMVERRDADLLIIEESLSLSDENLTCTAATHLNLDVFNSGAEDILVDVWVFNDEATLNQVTGKPESVSATYQEHFVVGELDAGETLEIENLLLNLSELTTAQDLYVYLVSPFFHDGSAFYFGDSGVVSIARVDSCLNTAALEAALLVQQSSEEGVSIDFFEVDADGEYLYIDEDVDHEADVTFSFAVDETGEDIGQSNEDLISCSVAANVLTCDAPAEDDAGVSELTFAVTAFSITQQESVTLTVSDTLSIDLISINGVAVAADGTAIVVPEDDITLAIELTNNLEQAITGITPSFTSVPLNFVTDTGINVGAGASGTLTVELGAIDIATADGEYPATVDVQGTALDGSAVTASFDFILDVQRDVTNVVVSDLTFADENLTCSESTTLTVELTNIGTQDEDDIMLNVTGPGDFAFATVEPITLAQSTQTTVTVDVLAEDLTVGENTFTATIEYRDGFLTAEDTVDFTKNVCLTAFTPEETSLSGVIGDEFDFTVTLGEDTPEVVEWSVTDAEDFAVVTSDSTLDFTYTADTIGTFTVNATANGEVQEWTVDVLGPLAIGEVSVNAVAVVENDDGDLLSTAVQPNTEVTVSVEVTNSLDHAITGVETQFATDIFTLPEEDVDPINLAAGETETVTLTGTLGFDVIAGEYEAVVSVVGDDFEDPVTTHTDTFEFAFVVEQDNADVSITNLTLADEDALTCAAGTTVTVELTNTGSVNEDDIIITVTGPNDFELSTEDDGLLSLAQGAQVTRDFDLPATNMDSGSNSYVVTVSYRSNFEQDSETVTVEKNACLTAFTPEETSHIIPDGETIDFSVTLAEEGFEDAVSWVVVDEDDTEVESVLGVDSYTFSETTEGTYTVTVSVHASEEAEESQSWTVAVTTVPLSDDFTLPTFTDDDDLSDYEGFTIENSFGKIAFTDGVDLTDVFDIDAVVVMSDGLVAIDSANAAELSGAATITLKKTFTNHRILQSTGFNDGNLVRCPTDVCQAVSNANGKFVFTVTGFSTYSVVEEQEAGLTLSAISFADVNRGATVNASVTLTNDGTFDDLTSLSSAFVGVDAKYNAVLTGLPSTLAAGASATLDVQVDVPSDESAGSHSIGSLQITGTNSSGGEVVGSAIITLNPKSFLTIESIKVNGKSSGDLSIIKDNEIKVKVQNDYTEDMDNVEVTVTILDVDGDDLEEDDSIGNLDVGDDDTASVTFDLAGENIDDNQYVIEVVVTGDADDGSFHETVETKTVDVDIKTHEVQISRASLSSSSLQCSRLTTLSVTVENIGEKDEDEVEVRVLNSALGLDLSRQDIEVDSFFDSDNDEKVSFSIDANGVAAGTYDLSVELSLDGELDDSAVVTLNVAECGSAGATSQTQPVAGSSIAQQLQDQLAAQLAAAQAQPATSGSSVTTTFRDSNTYIILLGVLVALVLIAVLLAIAVMVVRKN
jgi:hypothetical protein